MLSACNRYGEVLAAEVEAEDGPFHCPACQGPVILKQGRWLEEVKLVPVKLEEYMLPPNRYSGERRSRRYVSPRMLPPVCIPQLAPVWRKPWHDFPCAKLWCEPWDDR